MWSMECIECFDICEFCPSPSPPPPPPIPFLLVYYYILPQASLCLCISRTKEEVSHRSLYEALSFYWHACQDGRQHKLYIPAIGVSIYLILYLRYNIIISSSRSTCYYFIRVMWIVPFLAKTQFHISRCSELFW